MELYATFLSTQRNLNCFFNRKLVASAKKRMTEKFKVEFLPEAVAFMDSLDQKSQQKIYYNIKKSQLTNDPELFKKLNDNI